MNLMITFILIRMSKEAQQRFSELSQSYGTNWTRTNVSTLFEWINISAFNIRCLEICIKRYRNWIRNQMILNLILSTSSGTISISQFGLTGTEQVDFIIKIFLTIFTFMIALSAGALKIYQIQERLEEAIRLKQQWATFATGLGSELQLPIQLRIDGLWIIERNKKTYLDLLNTESDVSDDIKKRVSKELPHPVNMRLDVVNLPRILINIADGELTDMESANRRNKDKFSIIPPRHTNAVNEDVPNRISLNVAPLPILPPALPASPERDD